jgi:two-component system NtrC family sensor kinase
MGRRRKHVRKPSQRRHTARPRLRKAATGGADLREQLDLRTREFDDLLQQQIATSEILGIIRRSPADAQPVFEAIVQSAARLCGAIFSVVYLYENDHLRAAATKNFTAAAANQISERQELRQINRSYVGGRAFIDRAIVHIPDVLKDSEYSREFALAGGWRAVLAVPLLHEGRSVGALSVGKAEPKAFSQQQVRLLQTFADQAVIAIENVRLFNEVQARARDLSESLEQQTATSEVLKVISSSPGELQPVFDAMLANATRLCEAKFGHLWLFEGSTFRAVAVHGTQSFVDHMRRNPVLDLRTNPGVPLDRLANTKQVIHLPDIRADQSFIPKNAHLVALVEMSKARAFVAVPMLKERELIGAIVMYRQEVRPFTDKQVELVQNFAAQAVIAIENTRLLSELRESLQQQTATADVLKVISRSAFDLRVVLRALVESAAQLCEAVQAIVTQRGDDGFYRLAAGFGYPDEFEEYMRQNPLAPSRSTTTGRVALEGKIIHIPDVLADPEYVFPKGQQLGGYRSNLGVPLLRDGVPIGAFVLMRREVKPFTNKQIELVESFAAQAVIAIENARLLNELRQRTHELAASLDNLRTTQDRLVQTQKLASLGQLTAGIAHEIKNPLNFVNNFSGVSAELIEELQETLKDSNLNEKAREDVAELMETLRSNLDKVVQHGKRADAIVKNMLLHSHQGSSEHRLVAINAIVEESLKLAYHGARAEKDNFNIIVEQSFDPVAGEVDVFPQEITRVLLNLISNGVYATKKKTPRDGKIYKPTLIASTKDLGDRVEVTIRDNGIGIVRDVKDKMFNPFFTTKPAGEGTGLGLSISHDIIVKQHGGSIEVDTEPGEFTEVRIILPRTAGSI